MVELTLSKRWESAPAQVPKTPLCTLCTVEHLAIISGMFFILLICPASLSVLVSLKNSPEGF